METTEVTHTAGLLIVEDVTNTVSAPNDGIRSYRLPVAYFPSDTRNSAANARRMVAAWNACDGIPTETLERTNVQQHITNALDNWEDITKRHQKLQCHLLSMRGAMQTAVQAFDMLADRCTPANPCLVREFNRVIEETGASGALSQALAGGPDPWHLFYIEASDADGVHGFIVSAQSGARDKAEELARAAVDDSIDYKGEPYGDGEPAEYIPGSIIEHCRCIGIVDGDIFEHVGLLAD